MLIMSNIKEIRLKSDFSLQMFLLVNSLLEDKPTDIFGEIA